MLRIFSQGTEFPFPMFILGRVTGILQLKPGSSWEWGRVCCFWKSLHYLGKCLLNNVNDGKVEKNWSCGEYRVLNTGVRVQGGLSTYTHTPGLFWGLELKVFCDITGRLWSVLWLSHLPPSFLTAFSMLESPTPWSPDHPPSSSHNTASLPLVYLRLFCPQDLGPLDRAPLEVVLGWVRSDKAGPRGGSYPLGFWGQNAQVL